MTSPKERVVETFRERYDAEPTFLVRAPGRVNLIGEHTDYNDGFVLPLAIDRAVWLALRPREDERVEVHSVEFGKTRSFSLEGFGKGEGWLEYLKGTAWALRGAGYDLDGWEGVSSSDIPRASGLSSSAALELATARAFAAVSDLPWDAVRMAKLAQKAENDWVGVSCGVMDQLASAAGREGHAILIDCRSLEIEAVPLPEGAAVVVLNTGEQRGLVGSAYNKRREQCEAAARGALMNESHKSLRDDFEVSSDALDAIVACAWNAGCYGARMTGAGFGGCAVALVAQEGVDAFAQAVAPCYKEKTGREAEIYVCHAADGAAVG